MSLTEVIVAASVFLSACGGAARIGASSAAAMTQSRDRAAALEQIEAQFLAAPPLLQAAGNGSLDCAAAAQLMLQQLEAGLPPVPQSLQRQLTLATSGELVVLRVSGPAGLQRTRLLSPAAFGRCGESAAGVAMETAAGEAPDAMP